MPEDASSLGQRFRGTKPDPYVADVILKITDFLTQQACLAQSQNLDTPATLVYFSF
jgi:hypothetical protein